MIIIPSLRHETTQPSASLSTDHMLVPLPDRTKLGVPDTVPPSEDVTENLNGAGSGSSLSGL